MNYIKSTILLAVILFVGFVLPLYAQMDGPPPGERPGRERFEQLRRMKLIEALDLNEEQAVRLTVREKEFRETEDQKGKERREILKELQDLVENDADAAELLAVLAKMNEFHVAMVKEKHAFLLSLRDFLSVTQVAQMVLFEHKFTEEIKRLLGKSGGRPPRHK
jgi:hypothetical protein